MIRNILVLQPTFGIEHFLVRRGYNPMIDKGGEPEEDPDCVFFMGGTDIDPRLYGEEPIEYTQYPDRRRDAHEIAMYHKYKHKPKVGICRGAQLLNVLAGGSMIQHVSGHGGPDHVVEDIKGRKVLLCSVHHQMIVPAPNSLLVAWTTGLAKTQVTPNGVSHDVIEKEPEVLYIERDKALLFQAHPEFGPKTCTDYFFNLMEEYL